ncbi:MAG: metalloprotease PmbA [Arenicellales bacterium]
MNNHTWHPAPIDSQECTLLEIAELALSRAANKGATGAEVSMGHGQGISVTVRRGQVETVEHNRDKSLGVTVFFEHRSGSADTTDYSATAVESCVDAACNIARFTEQDEFNGLAEPDLLATEFPELDLYHPWDLDMEQAIELAQRCEQAALEQDKRITNTEGGSISSHHGSDLYANSNGFRGLSRNSRHSTSCSVIAGEGDGMQRDFWFDSCRDRNDLMLPEEVGKETARRTLRRLGARKIRTGDYPVIYEAPVAGSLMSHLVSAINGSSLYRQASFLLDSKGEQIFSRQIRIHEQPLLKKASGSASFDNEGVATKPRDIVSNGVLNEYVLNSYSARKLGLQTTGNAGGVHNLTIDSTINGGLEDLLSQMGTGLLVSELIGFGVNTVTGDYSRGAFGFWVENGKIEYPVQEFTIAGNLRDMFRSIEAVASDVDTRRSTRTGSLLISKLTVAGE